VKKTVFSLLILITAFMIAIMPPVQAQTTAFTQKGTVDVSSGVDKCFNFAGSLYKTDTTYTWGFETIGLQPIFDFSHYVTSVDDSVKVKYNLQGYYSYTAHWTTLQSLGTDSLRNTYYVQQDTVKYYPDSLRVMLWGVTAAVGSSIANGDSTHFKGSLKFPKK
jgi:hypothetical protein